MRCVSLTAPGDYDTHDNQGEDLAKGLKLTADSLLAFQRDLEARGLADRVLVHVWSEFGRRGEENGSDGTDHGAAGSGFLLGTRARGRMIGEFPGLGSRHTCEERSGALTDLHLGALLRLARRRCAAAGGKDDKNIPHHSSVCCTVACVPNDSASAMVWADYVQVQLLGFGLKPSSQSTSESQLWFYGKRLASTDPILIAFAALGLPALWKDLRERRSSAAVLFVCWIIVMSGALLVFRYRNLSYALSLIPPLAALGALYAPGGSWRILVLSAAMVGKMFFHEAAFGLPQEAAEPIPSAAALRAYAERDRPHDLIVVAPDDEFYSATLPLRHVRYAFMDEDGVVVRYAPHLAYLGVTVSVDEFLYWEKLYIDHRDRLHTWGSGTKPLATAIIAKSSSDVGRLAAGRPQSDFFLPQTLLTTLPQEALSNHEIVPAANGRVFLLAREAVSADRSRRSTDPLLSIASSQ